MLPPLHPLLVHFPIALLIGAFAMDVLGLLLKEDELRTSAFPTLILAVLGAIAALVTGHMAHDGLENLAISADLNELIEHHELAATITLGCAIAALAVRIFAEHRNEVDGAVGYVAMALLCLATLGVGATGYLGGKIVFDYGVGTTLFEKVEKKTPPPGQTAAPPATNNNNGPALEYPAREADSPRSTAPQ